MSSAASLILSASAFAIQTRCVLSPAVDAKEYRRCSTETDRNHQQGASSNLQAVRLQTGKLDGFARRNASSSVVNAGLGRFSGAVHGNSKGKSRSRRKLPVQQDDGDEHQDGSSGSDAPRTTQNTEDENGESTTGAEECEAFAAAEGIINKDGSSDSSQSLSYKRYLLELGVSPRPRENDITDEGDSQEFLEDPQTTVNERSSDKALQLSDEGNLKALQLSDEGNLNGNGVDFHTDKEAGEHEDMGHGGIEDLDTSKEWDPTSVPGNLAEKSDSVAEMEIKSENESIPREKTSSVDASVFPAPEPESSSENLVDDGHTDRIAETASVGELRFGSDDEPGKRKRRKKSKSKASVESTLTVEERGDNDRVRASSGGAERPAVPSDDTFPSMNGSVTASNEVGTFEAKTDFGIVEAPKEGADVGSISELSPVGESTNADGQTSIALASVLDSNSTIDTNDEDSSPDTPLSVLGKVGSQVVETVLEQTVQAAVKVVPAELVEQAAQVASQVVELPVVVAEQAAQVGGQVVEVLPDVIIEQVGQVVEQVSGFAEQVGHAVEQVSDVAEQVANTVNEQVEQVAESVSNTASQVAEQVTEFFSSDADDDSDSDDEFEAYVTSDLPDFRGKAGLDNFLVKQEHQGILSRIYDIYTYMLKQSAPNFAAAMFCTPIVVSGIFTLLYLPEFEGLAFDETARDFFAAAGGDSLKLHISWKTVFQVFMFSLSLSTGLQPELAPLSPYTLIVANLNALVAQLVFVFLSGAVFARLSQPSQPLRCSTVALVSASPAQRRRKENAIKVFMARYVLAGPQPCELVDVKVDLTYKYNTNTRTGSYFRATQSLKLVRPEIAFLTHGMLVRHVIDENSPLYQRTPEMLNKEDAVFCLSVVGLERSSMQSVFHVQHYCVVDNEVIWDAEFEDIILINKKNRRVVDHSRLSIWRPLLATQLLKLVRPDIAYLKLGMLVRHIIDENSPLHQKTTEMLKAEDGIFCLSVFGMERSSMRSIFHVQHYSVVDNDVIWDAEFEDMILVNKKNERVVDHSRLSLWKPFTN